MTRMRFRPWERLTIKAALALGFGATVVLWLLTGFQLTARMQSAQAEASAVSARYMHAQELLSSVRAQVLLGSVYVRDAVLDADPSSTPGYRSRLEDVYRSADDALGQYEPVLDSGAERERVAGLRRTIEDVRRASLNVLDTDSGRSSAHGLLLMSRDLGPRRDLALRVSDDIQAVNRNTFIQQQDQVAALYSMTQRRVWERLGLVLAVSLGIALVATKYVGRLERDLTRRRAKELQTTEELQRLSARLVSAQEEERRSIARELHDEIGQVLMAIKVELTVAQRAIEAQGGSRHLLDEAHAIADGALNTVRDLSHLLHPSILDDLGLPAAIEWYLNGFGTRNGLRVALTLDGMDERLAPEIESTLFRIVQEGLTNIVKHAIAARCDVELRGAGDRLTLIVQDDGIGFDIEGQARLGQRRGLGLIGIRERASSLGGATRVETAPGRGTRLIVDMPRRTRPVVADVEDVADTQDVRALPDPEMMRG